MRQGFKYYKDKIQKRMVFRRNKTIMKGNPKKKILLFVLTLAGIFGSVQVINFFLFYVNQDARIVKAAEENNTEAEIEEEMSLENTEDDTSEKEVDFKPVYDEDTKSTIYSCIYFGSYPQNQVIGDRLTSDIRNANYDENGDAIIYGDKYHKVENIFGTSYFVYEPIKWKIIANPEGCIVAMAERGLDYCSYYDAREQSKENTIDVEDLTDEELENYKDRRVAYDSVSWDESTIRSWLNSYGVKKNIANKNYKEDENGFLNRAFSELEKKDLKKAQEYWEKNFSQYVSSAQGDRVVLLNLAGALRQKYGFTEEISSSVGRVLEGTDYAVERGRELNDEFSNEGAWWIANGREEEGTIQYITKKGAVDMEGTKSYHSMLVRPVIVIDENSENIKDAGKIAVSNEDGDSISVQLKADTHVVLNEGKDGYKDATIEIFVKNIGSNPIETIDAILEFEDKEKILDGENSIHFSNIDSGMEKNITWKFAIKPQKEEITAIYKIKIIGNNLSDTYIKNEIYIPKIKEIRQQDDLDEYAYTEQENKTFLEKVRDFFKGLS